MGKRTVTGLTLRLEVEWEYELNGEDPKRLERLLLEGSKRLFDEGLVTGDESEAEVIRWRQWVVRVKDAFADDQNEE